MNEHFKNKFCQTGHNILLSSTEKDWNVHSHTSSEDKNMAECLSVLKLSSITLAILALLPRLTLSDIYVWKYTSLQPFYKLQYYLLVKN